MDAITAKEAGDGCQKNAKSRTSSPNPQRLSIDAKIVPSSSAASARWSPSGRQRSESMEQYLRGISARLMNADRDNETGSQVFPPFPRTPTPQEEAYNNNSSRINRSPRQRRYGGGKDGFPDRQVPLGFGQCSCPSTRKDPQITVQVENLLEIMESNGTLQGAGALPLTLWFPKRIEQIATSEEVEQACDYLENVCYHLELIRSELDSKIKMYQELQDQEIGPALERFDEVSGTLIETLKRIKTKENEIRERIDAFAHAALKTKKTIKTSARLSLTRAKQDTEKHNLGKIRKQRQAAVQELHQAVQMRAQTQNCLLDINTVSSELRKAQSKRDFHSVFKAISSDFFVDCFGPQEQGCMYQMAQRLNNARNASTSLIEQRKIVVVTLQDVRGRVARLVAHFWI